MQESLEQCQQEVAKLKTERNLYEDNMKKAFMRGVCALNMEAMTMFHHRDSGSVDEQYDHINSGENQSHVPIGETQFYRRPDLAPQHEACPQSQAIPVSGIPVFVTSSAPAVGSSSRMRTLAVSKPGHTDLSKRTTHKALTSAPTVVIEKH